MIGGLLAFRVINSAHISLLSIWNEQMMFKLALENYDKQNGTMEAIVFVAMMCLL